MEKHLEKHRFAEFYDFLFPEWIETRPNFENFMFDGFRKTYYTICGLLCQKGDKGLITKMIKTSKIIEQYREKTKKDIDFTKDDLNGTHLEKFWLHVLSTHSELLQPTYFSIQKIL